MEREAPRDLEILAERARTDQVTQRRLAARPSIALGLTNLNRKRLARTGFINSSWPRAVPPDAQGHGAEDATDIRVRELLSPALSGDPDGCSGRAPPRPAGSGPRWPSTARRRRRSRHFSLSGKSTGREGRLREDTVRTTCLDLPVRPLRRARPGAAQLLIVASFTPTSSRGCAPKDCRRRRL
jgi:hypothetical protein